ncbi:oligopeptide/dipeptide ABC transporter ATP-binding protein [Martelella sp. AD-3]|uniref:ABC transporter ATP-binding protein n=1 Tax=Martelella sp. AD-3 TaxID=686597 RepID=UPI000466DD83|nr:oligopeptide/dipeptide ABC transporter ATP-binding protein [Martelella sp. AD-3]AMM86199.1 peptide ABC transporter ATP-binding protein [Martelella sp. AD-3]MAM12206.1 ABC transporter ATP-binding protein [Rhizobiaceae bacterium]
MSAKTETGHTPLLRVEELKVHFPAGRKTLFSKEPQQVVKAVDGVSFHVCEGETLAIVGESGCGKSTTGNAILGLEPATEGRIFFRGRDLTEMNAMERAAMWRNLQVVFQDPVSALDPKRTIAQSIAEPLAIHNVPARERRARVDELLEQVGLNPGQRDRYPNELSGGQRQRVVIARALALKPDVIICDEAVSALDVSIQSQILNLLMRLQRELGLAYIFISHDLSVVRHIADRVVVMYLGTIVEEGPAATLFADPRHPYTQALLAAIPLPDPVAERNKVVQLLEGDLPSPLDPPKGCPFVTRCPIAESRCADDRPPARHTDAGARRLACFLR